MNILIITQNYPLYINEPRGRSTYAIHGIVKHWTYNNRVIVLRPVEPKKRELFSFCHTYKKFKLDDVMVIPIPLVDKKYLNKIQAKSKLASILKYILVMVFYVKDNSKIYYKKLLKGFTPDILLAHWDRSLYIVHKLKNIYEKKVIYGIHEGDILYPDRTSIHLQTADAISFRSLSIKRRFYSLFPENKLPHTTSISGIPEEIIINSKKYGKICNILFVGRLENKKNVKDLINAFNRLSHIENWSFDIVGEWSQENNLKMLVDNSKIANRVKFHGYQPHKKCLQMMEHAHIFIMVSAPETFGLVYLEAMAKGCIVIGAKGWGIDGIIHNGDNGYLCEPGNIEEIAHTIEYVMRMPQQQVLNRSYETILELTERKVSIDYLEFVNQIYSE